MIDLDRLDVSLGGRPVLRSLSATLRGRAIGLLGPNGAGKTTLLHTLLGFHAPAGGEARVLGRDVVGDPGAVREVVGYMPEREAFLGAMTGVRFVRLMAELSGLSPADALERAHEALFYVGLGEARYRRLSTYSMGMKQLAKLAQALVHGPRLLFLDEPTNGLDPPARRRMLELVARIRDSGRAAIVLSSHLLRDVEMVCDEVLVLKAGKVAHVCDLEAERRSHRRFLDLDLVGDREALIAGLERRGAVCEGNGRVRLRVTLPETMEPAEVFAVAAESAVEVRRLQIKRDSLEDIFLRAMESD